MKSDRLFFVGDEWLYYKIYCGIKISDEILVTVFKPLVLDLSTLNYIDKYFFLRYSDPEFHIRFRFHINQTKKENLHHVIIMVNEKLKPLINQGFVWKITVDTYARELERYGTNCIEISESIFYHDSTLIMEILQCFYDQVYNEDDRWKIALLITDYLISDFGFTTEQKYSLLKTLRENYGVEFNINKNLRNQLAVKYRKDYNTIRDVLNHKNNFGKIEQNLIKRSTDIKRLFYKIHQLYSSNLLDIPIERLLSSYIHMQLNRLFKSKQRLVHSTSKCNFIVNKIIKYIFRAIII
jgi:thiopeptide-type bacteriocin biosynthesis protein